MGFSLRNFILLMLMLAAAGMSHYRPTVKLADQSEKLILEKSISATFEDWQVDDTIVPIQADPERQALINKIYNQTLSRTYFNKHGQRVMLSIAYGGDQSDALQVHKPEVCYTGQGFQILKEEITEIPTEYGRLPVKRLLAVLGSRNEPITYWFTVGDHVAKNKLDFKLHQLRYSLTGKIPDGMLVRVSTIDMNEKSAYEIQENFVRDLLKSMSPKDRVRFIGTFNS